MGAQMCNKAVSSSIFRPISGQAISFTMYTSGPGARWFSKQTYNKFYPKFLVKQNYNVF